MTTTFKTRLLNVEEFAAALGLKPGTIRSWVFYEMVPFVKVGRTVRFRLETAEAIQSGELQIESTRPKERVRRPAPAARAVSRIGRAGASRQVVIS